MFALLERLCHWRLRVWRLLDERQAFVSSKLDCPDCLGPVRWLDAEKHVSPVLLLHVTLGPRAKDPSLHEQFGMEF